VAILFTSSNLGEQIVSRAVLRMSTAWLTIREPAASLFHLLGFGSPHSRTSRVISVGFSRRCLHLKRPKSMSFYSVILFAVSGAFGDG
jgi:hypothetical protein